MTQRILMNLWILNFIAVVMNEGGDNMNEIISVLMKRDGMTYQDAKEYLERSRQEFYEMCSEPDFDIDEFMCDAFGLEPDYIDYFLI